LEQRQARRTEVTAEAQGDLGCPHTAADRGRIRELALFDLAIDSKLRACDLVRLRVRGVAHGERVAARTIVMQQKTQRLGELSSPVANTLIDHAAVEAHMRINRIL
jgi:hypothetical protein